MKNSYLFLVLLLFALPGCSAVGVATGAGAAAGVAAAQEGGLGRAVSDARIQIEINDLWFRYDVNTFRKLDMTVSQGRILLTGLVQNPEARVEAVRLAWQPKGVKQVINEIRVAESDGIVGFARDSWITARLRTAITFDRDVQSINYSIDTVQGTVYLMGFAQSQAELNRVIETARTISDVRQVVSYVKLVGEQEDTYEPPPPDVYSEQPADTYTEPASEPVQEGVPQVSQDMQLKSEDLIEAQSVPAVEAEPVADSDPITWNTQR